MGARFSIVAAAALAAFHAFAGGCSQELRARSTIELMEDPPVLEAVILRCQSMHRSALEDEECRNARDAVERLAAREAETKKVDVDPGFERAREERRARDERERLQREAQQQVDPYTLPLVKDPQPEAQVHSEPQAPLAS